jgi:hypothetical protein
VELIGRIIEVKPGVGRRGKGKGRPFVFINFGPWRGSIVKITIWSEGLDKVKDKPSEAWVGRWVSVTGLLDPPYVSPRYKYTHLSITVAEDGQIQEIAEPQALFRLASIGKANPQSIRKAEDQNTQKANVRFPGPTTVGNPSAQQSRNSDIVRHYTSQTKGSGSQGISVQQTHSTSSQGQSQKPPIISTPPPQVSSPSTRRAAARVPWWLWASLAGFIIYLLGGHH